MLNISKYPSFKAILHKLIWACNNIYYLCVFEGLCWFWWGWCWTWKTQHVHNSHLHYFSAVSHISVELFLWVQHVFGDNRRSMETFEPSGSSLCMSQCPRGVAELICFHVTLSVCCTDIASLLPRSLTLGKII